jgi:hypothetical protein
MIYYIEGNTEDLGLFVNMERCRMHVNFYLETLREEATWEI